MVAEAVPEATAAALEDTAVLVEEAPPVIEQTETPEASTTETELVGATETAPDAPSWADHLAEVEEKELLENDRIKSLLARKEESLRQRIERDQQLKAGADQQVQGTLTRLMAMFDAGEITSPQFQQTAQHLIVAAKTFADQEWAVALPDILLSEYKIASEFKERALEAREQDGLNRKRYTKILIEGAVESERGKTRLKDVPEGSPLHKDVQAEVAKRLESELKAQGLETQPKRESPPATPRGTGGANVPQAKLREQIEQMNTNAWLAMPGAERQKMLRDAGLVA